MSSITAQENFSVVIIKGSFTEFEDSTPVRNDATRGELNKYMPVDAEGTPSSHLDQCDPSSGSDVITTLMIHGVPFSFTHRKLIQALEHSSPEGSPQRDPRSIDSS